MIRSPVPPLTTFKLVLSAMLSLCPMAISQCEESDADGDGWTVSEGDCDDATASTHPGATELCDGVDNDCDGTVDDARSWYLDADDDGYGTASDMLSDCEAPDGYVASHDDCDDADSSIHPEAAERCDLLDNDCDLAIDEGLPDHRWLDRDLDGFGSETAVSCGDADGYIAVRGDCDDTDPSIHPGAADPADDGLDQDCGGTPDAEPHVGLSSTSAQSIQAALNDAPAGATIWVAAGTYLEHDIQFTGRAVSLRSTQGPAQTIIDAHGLGRVMTLNRGESLDTEIDGFTLTGGYVVGSSGGAVLVRDSSPTFRHCIVSGNTAEGPESAEGEGGNGGGVYLENSSALFVQSDFTANDVRFTVYEVCEDSGYCSDQKFGGYGGGMQIYLGEPRVSNCTFYENQPDAGTRGGALHILEATPEVTDTLFSHNKISIGGAVSVQNSTAVFSRCEFNENFSGIGAALDASYSEVVLDHSRFASNHAEDGAAVYAYYSSLMITYSNFSGNVATDRGGAIYLFAYDTDASTFQYNLFSGNSAVNKGGAIYVAMAASDVRHNSIVGNAAAEGGGIYMYDDCTPVFINNLITHNVGYNLFNDLQFPCNPTLSSNGLYSATGPSHNLDSLDDSNTLEDPDYIHYTPNGDSDDDEFHLKPASSMHDAGAPGTHDLDGSTAELGTYGGEVDEPSWYQDLDLDGLYDGWERRYGLDPTTADGDGDLDQDGLSNSVEFEVGTLPNLADSDGDGATDGEESAVGADPSDWYVQPDGDSVTTKTAQVPADFPSIQEAVNAVRSSGVIELAAGRYTGTTSINGKAVSLRGLGDPSETVLDGQGLTTPLTSLWSTLEVSGLTITDGQGENGGGMRLQNVDGLLTDLIVYGNGATSGAGVYAHRGKLELSRVQLNDNSADPYSGGGMLAWELELSISNTVFVQNSGRFGGGLDAADSTVEMVQVYFQENVGAVGGAMALSDSSFTINGCMAIDNEATDSGGAMYLSATSGTVQHCTLIGNRAQNGAGGLYAYGNTTELIEISDSIIAYSVGYNVASMYPLEISEGSPRVTVEYSNLYASEGEENHNLPTLSETTTTVEPGFLAYEGDLPVDLHLSLLSPLLDTGDPSLTDPDGSRSDPGAFGGPDAGSWDVDLDGVMDYFWPGTLEDAPSGFDPAQFDADDRDAAVQ